MPHLTDNIKNHRSNRFDSDEIFRNRWSPRAMTGQSVSDDDLMAMFEAAHWAPSAYNNQPWRFIYARREQPEWEKFMGLLVDFNRQWCRNAGVLMITAAKTTFDHNGKFSRTHAFDTGAAWGMFALEGARRGLVVHGMQGFDYDKAAELIGLPDDYAVQMMAAVGVLADPSVLPPDIAKNEKPTPRKELSQIIAPGKFTDDIK